MNNIIIPPWVKFVAAVLLVIAVLAAIYAYGQQQFGLGETAERAAWLKRENTALAAANARIKTLEEEARAKEHAHADAIAAISAQYQKDLSHEKATKDSVIADLRSGVRRLRIELASPHATGGSDGSQVGASAGRCDGSAYGELSGPASEFLVGLASEADEVVHQLTACQAMVIKDRQLQGEQ